MSSTPSFPRRRPLFTESLLHSPTDRTDSFPQRRQGGPTRNLFGDPLDGDDVGVALAPVLPLLKRDRLEGLDSLASKLPWDYRNSGNSGRTHWKSQHGVHRYDENSTHFYQTHMPNALVMPSFTCELKSEDASNATWFSWNGVNRLHIKVGPLGTDTDPIINDAYVARVLCEKYRETGNFLNYVAAFQGHKTAYRSSVNPGVFKPYDGAVPVACLATISVPGPDGAIPHHTFDPYASPGKSPARGQSAATGPLSLGELVRTGAVDGVELAALFASLVRAGQELGFSHNDLHLLNVLQNGHNGRLVAIDYGRSHLCVGAEILAEERGKYGDGFATFDHDAHVHKHNACAAGVGKLQAMYVMNDIMALYQGMTNLNPGLRMGVSIPLNQLQKLRFGNPLEFALALPSKWLSVLMGIGFSMTELAETTGDANKIFWVNTKMLQHPTMLAAATKAYAEVMVPYVDAWLLASAANGSSGGGNSGNKKSKSNIRKVVTERSSSRKYVVVEKQRHYLDQHRGCYRYTTENKDHVILLGSLASM